MKLFFLHHWCFQQIRWSLSGSWLGISQHNNRNGALAIVRLSKATLSLCPHALLSMLSSAIKSILSVFLLIRLYRMLQLSLLCWVSMMWVSFFWVRINARFMMKWFIIFRPVWDTWCKSWIWRGTWRSSARTGEAWSASPSSRSRRKSSPTWCQFYKTFFLHSWWWGEIS
jgi:hypothetical protein